MREINKELILDCLSKLDKISDETWESLVDKYELEWNSDHLRKVSYGMKAYRDCMGVNDTEEFIKLKKEKQKLSDIRNCVNKDIRQLSKIENILDLIINECKDIPNFKLVDVEKVEVYPNGNKANLFISDLHYDCTETPVSNFNKLIDITINKSKLHAINQLNVLLGGDLINNELKTTIRLENQENVSKQLVGVSKLISDGLYKLAKHIPMVTYAIVSGNHERSFEDYKKSMTTDNYLPIIKELVELRVSDLHNIVKLPNTLIDGEIDDRFCIMKIDEKIHVLTHGDALKNLERSAISTVEGYLGVKIDYLYVAHFHSPKSFMTYDSNVIVNGYCGNSSDYGRKLLLRTPPIQKIMILNKGDVECTYDIKLDGV